MQASGKERVKEEETEKTPGRDLSVTHMNCNQAKIFYATLDPKMGCMVVFDRVVDRSENIAK